ncbi:MAG TPA: hypothetical protein VFQ45_21280 [Longimicrobium sp.]|nr:hypothetical protein [Longimicrobium sp.]
MRQAQRGHRHHHVLVSVHGTDGLDFVELDRAAPLRVLLHNHMEASYPLRGTGRLLPPHVHVDLGGLGEVELDPAAVRAPGWKVTGWEDGALRLAPVGRRGWFRNRTVLAVDLGPVTVRGEPGLGMVAVTLERFDAAVDGTTSVGVLRLAAGCARADAVAVEWTEGGSVRRTPRHARPRVNALRMRIPAALRGRELYLSTALAGSGRYRHLTSAGRADDIEVSAAGGWRAHRTASGGMPVYRIHPAGSVFAHSDADELVAVAEPIEPVEIQLDNVVSDQTSGTSQLVLYTSAGYSVTPVLVEEGDVAINSFTADIDTFDDITSPVEVNLSWDVDNATSVTLSGVGVVDPKVTNHAVTIEQTTTFVLTAFDSSLTSISSESLTVEVNPSISSRMVPAGTILLWSGTTATIPSGWSLCDGTGGTPDLTDRFVMGAGGGESPGAGGDADTHTHAIPQLSSTFNTSYNGAHTHGMPTSWYHRSLSSGGKTGIDTDGTFNNNTQTQSSGNHQHSVGVTFAAFASGENNGDVRPPWYALAYIMKLASTT